MAAITLRSVKGSPLTNTEMDDNLTNLNNDKIEADGVTFGNLDANGDVGTGSAQVAQGNHTHNNLTFDVLTLNASPIEKVVALSATSGAISVDLDAAPIHEGPLIAAATITFTNLPAAGFSKSVTLRLENAGTFLAFAQTITWTDGAPPDWTVTGKDFITFLFINDGTTNEIHGFPAGLNHS